jgi:hypothetical protein
VEVSNGVFYGTTSGTYGSVYQITRAGAFSVLAGFNGTNGYSSWAGLAKGTDGNYYGTTAEGGTTNTTRPVFQKPTLANGMFTVNAAAVTGQSYQLQYKTNLTQPSWSNLGSPVTATNGSISVSDTVTGVPKFYRVTLVQ